MINYKHLHYFWMVAKEKSIVRASERLNLTPQTISGQLSLLEETLGVALFDRVGRHLELTDTGHRVLAYADEIFSLGNELESVVHDQPTEPVLTLNVGIADVVPKSIAYRLLEPALHIPAPVRLNCRESNLDTLLADLNRHKLDLVISDSQISADLNSRGFNRLLGESRLTFFAAPKLADTFKLAFPNCLDNAPLLLPGSASGIRLQIQQWFDRRHIHPRIVGEFDDSALMEKFGQAGIGIFAVPTAIKTEVEDKCEVVSIGEAEDLTIQFHAISMLRKVSHPAVTAITARAGDWLSPNTADS